MTSIHKGWDVSVAKGRPAGDKGFRISQARVTPVRAILIAIVAAVVAGLYERTPVHGFIETRSSLPLLYTLRDRLGQTPKLDPRLKIFTYDDTTFARMGSPDLTLDQWVSLLKTIDAHRPRMIVIDQIFGMTPRPINDKTKLLTSLAQIETPIATAAYVAKSPSKLRRPLDTTKELYELKSYFLDRKSLLKHGMPPLASRLGWRIYGPNPDMAKALKNVGHVLDAGRGFASGIVQVGPATVIPHLAFLGDKRPEFKGGRLHLDDRVVPTDGDGQVVVDFATPKAYYKHSRRLLPLLEAVSTGKDISGVKPGDVVLILPAMFTGNTDFTETPVGPLPGGFVIATLLNSRLTGDWVAPLLGRDGPILIGAALGVGAAFVASGYLAFPVLLFAAFGSLFGVVALFAYAGLLTSVTAPLLGMSLAAGGVMSERFRVRDRLLRMMRVLKLENEQMQLELDQAGEISRAFIPAKVPKWDDLVVGAFHQPLTGASGDWYAFERSASGRYMHFLMCDISGHGAQAAIIVSTCKTVLSMLVSENPASLESQNFVAHYATLLNSTLCAQGGGRHTATFIGLTIDRDTEVLHCLLAGHPRALVFGHEQQGAYVGKPGSLLGLTMGPKLTVVTVPFRAGDSVVAYTDGVPFPRASSKVQKIFETYRHLDPDSAAKYMAVEAREQSPTVGDHFDDDVSLVWFRRRDSRDEINRQAG